jgi:hypothetical protein
MKPSNSASDEGPSIMLNWSRGQIRELGHINTVRVIRIVKITVINGGRRR